MQSTTNANTTLAAPAIGTYWHRQGGIYAGILRNPANNEQWHLIMAEQAIAPAAWGPYENIPNTNSRHDGLSNTQAMIAAGLDQPIVTAIAKLTIDGHNDFYWPAQLEQNLLCANLQDMLEPTWHWSGTQYSAHGAWNQHCRDGDQLTNLKGLEFAVRAVRRLPI